MCKREGDFDALDRRIELLGAARLFRKPYISSYSQCDKVDKKDCMVEQRE